MLTVRTVNGPHGESFSVDIQSPQTIQQKLAFSPVVVNFHAGCSLCGVRNSGISDGLRSWLSVFLLFLETKVDLIGHVTVR
jgi:hypothetical protein